MTSAETEKDLQRLKDACAEATGGMRHMYNGWGPDPNGKMHVLKVGGPFDSIFEASGGGDIIGSRADFEYLAVFPPSVVSELIERIESAERTLLQVGALEDGYIEDGAEAGRIVTLIGDVVQDYFRRTSALPGSEEKELEI